jgi:hypothetical protein
MFGMVFASQMLGTHPHFPFPRRTLASFYRLVVQPN